jgi:hypothetical protein
MIIELIRVVNVFNVKPLALKKSFYIFDAYFAQIPTHICNVN